MKIKERRKVGNGLRKFKDNMVEIEGMENIKVDGKRNRRMIRVECLRGRKERRKGGRMLKRIGKLKREERIFGKGMKVKESNVDEERIEVKMVKRIL